MTAPKCPGALSRLHPGVMRMCPTTCVRWAYAAEGIEPAMRRDESGAWQCDNWLAIAEDVAEQERAA